jgi:hypothetical protein
MSAKQRARLAVPIRAYFGVFVELVGGDVVDGEYKLDIVLLSLLDEVFDLLRPSLIEERLADLFGKSAVNQEFLQDSSLRRCLESS